MSSMFNPENFTIGSGLIDDVDVLFKEVRVVNFDYNGTVFPAPPALKVTMEVDGQDEDAEQYYTMGKPTDWQPSEDGTKIIAVGKATGISASSNAALLISSMVDAGFPANQIEDDVRCFEGLKAHMLRVPAPKRNTTKAPRADGKVYEDTVLTVASIISLPGEGAAKGNKASKPAAGKPNTGGTKAASKPAAPAASAGDDVDSRCSELIIELLSENGGSLEKNKIPGMVFNKVKTEPNKNAIITRIFQEDFLSSGAWTYEGGVVSLG